jgi:hypothetical protein
MACVARVRLGVFDRPAPEHGGGYNTGGTFIAGTGGMFFLFNAIVLRPAVLNC